MANFVLGRANTKFELIKELGRGGFGVVHLARDEAKNDYAIKLIGPVSDATIQETFEREVKSAQNIDHPNVLKVIDFGSSEDAAGNLYLFTAMEYCPDGDYRRALSGYAKSPLDVHRVLEDFDQILTGLQALHSHVVHRDMKPENVLVNGGLLKICDFGLSKFVDEATKTLTFKGGGSPRYMAPEVWELGRATQATDLYAVGVMLYEALTGRPPFEAKDITAIRNLHLYQPAPRARTLVPAVPEKLDGIVKKLLIKEPASRYQTATEVLGALRTVHQGNSDAAITAIASQARAHHDTAELQRLEERKRNEAARREIDRNRYKEQELVDLIDGVVTEVNSHLEEVKIERNKKNRVLAATMYSGGTQPVTYSFGSRSLVIKFFSDGELYSNSEAPGRLETLRKRYVVHGGYIEIKDNGEDREGWNLVLVRPPESLYGNWIVVETKVSAITGRSTKYEPIATEAQLFADNLACHWMPAMHVYQLTSKPLERSDIIKIIQTFIPR